MTSTPSTPRWSSSPRASRAIASFSYAAGSCGLSDSPWPRASSAITRRPAATSASTKPGATQLTRWSAANPCSRSASGPSPAIVYAMPTPSNDVNRSIELSYAAMTLRVVGAGLGRTGTHSLKNALEQLLGGPCYHMIEVFGRPDDIEVWRRAVNGDQPDWSAFLADYESAVDWPACSFWREISAANPEAVVLLSSRDADGWWKSATNTIFHITRNDVGPVDDNMTA